MIPRTFVITCDKYVWAMQPFAYLYNKYYGDKVVYGTFREPEFTLSDNFTYFQIDTYNYPAERWSDGLMRMLERSPDEFIVLLLEDYWIARHVDKRAIERLHEYMKANRNILRFDLTDDRQYNGHAKNVGYIAEYDIVETLEDAEYNMSLQAGLWNTELLYSLLEKNKTAWEVEIHTNPSPQMRIMGTRQSPIRYANGLLKGVLDNSQLEKLRPDDRETVKQWIPKEFLTNK